MLRIAHVISSLAPHYGGPTFVAASVSRALARRGHRVYLLTTDRGGVSPDIGAILRDGVDYRISKELIHSLAYSPGLAGNLRDLACNLDLIHIHGLYLFPTIAAGTIGTQFGIPYIIRTTGALDPFHLNRKRLRKYVFDYFVQERVLRNAAAFHYTTELEKTSSEPNARGRPSIIVPNGLDLHEASNLPKLGAFRSRFPEIGNRRIVLFLGRINFKKGFEILIPAFAQVLSRTKDVHLVIAGNDDGYLRPVKQLVDKAGIARSVSIVGFLSGQEKAEAFMDSSVFVLPSYSENFANALFEALAAGLPAIISNRVNTWPEIHTAGAGLVIEPTIQQLADALFSLISNNDLRTVMAGKASTFARSTYSWDSVVTTLEGEYERILSEWNSRVRTSIGY